MQDTLPPWFTADTERFMRSGGAYLPDGVHINDRIRQVAKAVKDNLGPAVPGDIEGRVYEVLWKGWCSLSTPIWTNFGNDRGLPISCYNSHFSDTVESLLGSTHGELAMMTKAGGGTSGYYGDVRPRGSPIQGGANGTSFGSVHFAVHHQSLIRTCSQGNCYAEGTEVMTDSGFKDFREVLPTDKLAQLDERGIVTFTATYELVRSQFRGQLRSLRLKKQGDVICRVTPNHRMVVKKLKMKNWERYWPDESEIVLASDLKLHRDNHIPAAGYAPKTGREFTFADRFRVAYQADGRKDCNRQKIRFRFKKERKVERMRWIAAGLGVGFKLEEKDGVTSIVFEGNPSLKVGKFSDWVNLSDVGVEWAEQFLEEVSHWDGGRVGCRREYFSGDKENIDFVQALAAMCGRKTRLWTRPAYGTRQPLHKLTICEQDYRGGESLVWDDEHYDGTVYCAIVPHGRLLVRTGGQVTVCGNTRRGNFAGYWPVEHGDIEEVLGIRGDGHPIQDIHFGVTFGDDWLNEMKAGDQKKRAIWAKVLTARRKTGEPYLMFRDTVNRNLPPWYKDKGLTCKSSNLCVETVPISDEKWSYVCCLLSANISKYDEWCDRPDAVETMVFILDAVITEFIRKAKTIPFMERAVRYAEDHRSIGIGWLGWHDYLQSHMVSFDSNEARAINLKVAKFIHRHSVAASERLAVLLGEAPVCRGYGRRNALLQAIAPTKSTSFILGQTSEGIEPRQSNYVIEDKAKGKFTFRNPHLNRLLAEKEVDVDSVWKEILVSGGSVQKLGCLTDREKQVFRTFVEIPQIAVVQQAAQRQPYIDQMQSLNVLIHPDIPAKDVSKLYLTGWETGVKSYYYQHADNAAQLYAREILSCSACEA